MCFNDFEYPYYPGRSYAFWKSIQATERSWRFTAALSLITLSIISASKHPRLLLCIALVVGYFEVIIHELSLSSHNYLLLLSLGTFQALLRWALYLGRTLMATVHLPEIVPSGISQFLCVGFPSHSSLRTLLASIQSTGWIPFSFLTSNTVGQHSVNRLDSLLIPHFEHCWAAFSQPTN